MQLSLLVLCLLLELTLCLTLRLHPVANDQPHCYDQGLRKRG